MLYVVTAIRYSRCFNPLPTMKLRSTLPPRGFSLVELLLTIALVAVLVVMTFTGYGIYAKKGENKQCFEKLRNHGVAFGNYLGDKHTWPQEPEGENGKPVPAKQLWEWWFKEMEPYGITEDYWFCPAELREMKKLEKEGKLEEDEISPSYIPAKIPYGTSAPFDYVNQPWMWERQDFHGDGINKLMPGGSRIEKEINFKALPRGAAGPAQAPSK